MSITSIITESLNSRIGSSIISARKELERAEYSYKVWSEAMVPKIEFFKEHESEIISLLKQYGFAFDENESLHCSPVGDDQWRRDHDPTDQSALHINAYFKMVGRSPVSTEKAQKRIVYDVEEGFRTTFNDRVIVSINMYSLKRKDRILVDIWVK